MYFTKIKDTLDEIKEVAEKMTINIENEALIKEYSSKLNLLTSIINVLTSTINSVVEKN
ncbi:MAG: hypothetical protein PHX18_06375 [Candidatus Gastranaerophilales bacterium]|nr:hypothetical protein [Candidatus Gastranaerophilales bacterium]